VGALTNRLPAASGHAHNRARASARRIRNVARWLAPACCLLSLTTWAISTCWSFGTVVSAPRSVYVFLFAAGNMTVVRFTGDDWSLDAMSKFWRKRTNWEKLRASPKFGFIRPHWTDLPQNFSNGARLRTQFIRLPMWMIFAPLMVLTALLHRRKRKKVVGYCRTCDYDLTGNISGVCSECGTPIEASAK
jgi:hypothetical protein